MWKHGVVVPRLSSNDFDAATRGVTASNRTMQTESVDLDDAPELTDEFFQQADEYVGDRLVTPRTWANGAQPQNHDA